MVRSIQVASLAWFLFVNSFAQGVEPVAKISGPSVGLVHHDIVLSFVGSVSEHPLEYEVAQAPVGSTAILVPLYDKDQKLSYAMFVPDLAGLYRFAVIASANDPQGKILRKYDFHDAVVADTPDIDTPPKPDRPPKPPKPDRPPKPPKPIEPPGPDTPPPSPQVDEKYGLYTFCRQVLARIPDNGTWKKEASEVAKVFTNMANTANDYKDPSEFVLETSNDYKYVLQASYPFWSQHFFNSLKAQLATLNRSGKLPSDVSSHADAWREIAAALNEVRP